MDETQDKEQEHLRQKLVLETRWLMTLEETERVEYVRGVINGLAQSFRKISSYEGNIPEKVAIINAFLQELDEKAPTLIPPITYAIKDEYQDVFRTFLNQMVLGVTPRIKNLKSQGL